MFVIVIAGGAQTEYSLKCDWTIFRFAVLYSNCETRIS